MLLRPLPFRATMHESILIGTRGWEHPLWQGRFYPEELPADWRFCYYSNWLRAVLVPAETWEEVEAADVHTWVEDSDPEFRFVLELPRALSGPAAGNRRSVLTEFFQRIEPIRHQTAGLLLRLAPCEADGAWLEDLLGRLGTAYPLCVDLPRAWRTPEVLAAAAHHAAGVAWHCAEESAPHPGGRLMVAFARMGEPKAQRRLLETLAAWQGKSGGVAALIFDDPRAGAEQAKQARLLAEIMGV